jgi:SecD/SecF fusion protein
VLTRSLATTFCTLMPVVALLLFGGNETLQDFAFALLIGVASGAYSSIFIASPVLTHWKEREHSYRARRQRLVSELGAVPAYAGAGADVDPDQKRPRRTGRLTTPDPDGVSSAEFEQMKRDLDIERGQPPRHTSTLTKRLAHTDEDGGDGAAATQGPRTATPPRGKRPGQARRPVPKPAAPPAAPLAAEPEKAQPLGPERPVTPAPDIAENDGMAPRDKPKPKSKSRNKRHGRRR